MPGSAQKTILRTVPGHPYWKAYITLKNKLNCRRYNWNIDIVDYDIDNGLNYWEASEKNIGWVKEASVRTNKLVYVILIHWVHSVCLISVALISAAFSVYSSSLTVFLVFSFADCKLPNKWIAVKLQTMVSSFVPLLVVFLLLFKCWGLYRAVKNRKALSELFMSYLGLSKTKC